MIALWSQSTLNKIQMLIITTTTTTRTRTRTVPTWPIHPVLQQLKTFSTTSGKLQLPTKQSTNPTTITIMLKKVKGPSACLSHIYLWFVSWYTFLLSLPFSLYNQKQNHKNCCAFSAEEHSSYNCAWENSLNISMSTSRDCPCAVLKHLVKWYVSGNKNSLLFCTGS